MNYYTYLEQIPNHIHSVTTLRFPGIKPYGKISFGFGTARTIGEEAKNLGCQRILIVTDKVITGLGSHMVLTEILESAGCSFDVFDAVEAEPGLECAVAVQSTVIKGGYDLIIGLGGGSVLDMAKVAALVATNTDDIGLYFNGKTFTKEGLPLFLLPTTSGTGSEISPYIVVKDGLIKKFIGTSLAFASIAIIDPLFSVTMPCEVTAATGLDALSHGIEGAIAKQDPFNEALAEKCIELVFRYLPRAYKNGEDLEARYYMSFASVLGMMAYVQGGGLYAHSISYILTSGYGIPHGIGCGLGLPYTLAMNSGQIPELMKKFDHSAILGREFNIQHIDEGIVSNLQGLLKELNVPGNLRDMGMRRSIKNDFIDELMGTYVRSKNPVQLDRETSGNLFEALWNGTSDKKNQ